MGIRNIGDKYYARLGKSDSHGRSNFNWINVLVKTRPVHRGKNIFWGLERPLEVPKVGDMFYPTPASEDLCQGSHPRLRRDDS